MSANPKSGLFNELNLKPAPETLFIVSIKALTITIKLLFKLLFKRQTIFLLLFSFFLAKLEADLFEWNPMEESPSNTHFYFVGFNKQSVSLQLDCLCNNL